MKLVLAEDFPASPPRGFFLTKIYHPNVALNGLFALPMDLTTFLRRHLRQHTQAGLERGGYFEAHLASHPLSLDRSVPGVVSQRRGWEALYGQLR
jgi:hypothetical protein